MKVLLLLAVMTLTSSCRTTTGNTGADAKALAAVRGAKNIALLTSGMWKEEGDDFESLEATTRLTDTLALLAPDAPFEIREFHNITKAELLKYTAEAARDVGKDGTLFWYVATHGWTDGFSMKEGAASRVKAADLDQALRAGRAGKPPIERLFMLFDYCGAGGIVGEMKLKDKAPEATLDGVGVNLATASPEDLARLKRRNPQGFADLISELATVLSAPADRLGLSNSVSDSSHIYRQALFMSPVTPMQETLGDTFTTAISTVVYDYSAQKTGLTIGGFVDETVKMVATYETEDFRSDAEDDFVMKPQKVVYRALPDDKILKDDLFPPAPASP